MCKRLDTNELRGAAYRARDTGVIPPGRQSVQRVIAMGHPLQDDTRRIDSAKNRVR